MKRRRVLDNELTTHVIASGNSLNKYMEIGQLFIPILLYYQLNMTKLFQPIYLH